MMKSVVGLRFSLAALPLVLTLLFGSGSVEAGACGVMLGGRLGFNQVITEFAVPDHFPPESPALLTIIGTVPSLMSLTSCHLAGRVSLEPGCINHDRCYDTAGADKLACDVALLDDWASACDQAYRGFSALELIGQGGPDVLHRVFCRMSCFSFIQGMSNAQIMNLNGFCPSCEAYESAQRNPVYFPPSSESE